MVVWLLLTANPISSAKPDILFSMQMLENLNLGTCTGCILGLLSFFRIIGSMHKINNVQLKTLPCLTIRKILMMVDLYPLTKMEACITLYNIFMVSMNEFEKL